MSTSSTPEASIALIEKLIFCAPPPNAKFGVMSTGIDGVTTSGPLSPTTMPPSAYPLLPIAPPAPPRFCPVVFPPLK